MQATIYTIEEAAKVLSVHAETLRRAVRRGDLKAAYIANRFRISEAELERYWDSLGGGQLWDRPKTAKSTPAVRAAAPKAAATKKAAAKKTTRKKARA
jgi:excisionase family DNA binding protein